MKLVIVESPTKAKTIGKFLGNDYTIKASMGHVLDLPKSTLGVDTNNNFTPQYEVSEDKKKIVSELKTAAKNAESIILATDPDREGEAIASHVKDMLSSNSKFKIQNSKFQRIVFHEITENAIKDALNHPRNIDEHLVNAQTARRVLDRLVGYKLSPVLWRKVRRGLSAGRVQSVALRLIVEREREIEKFKKEQYYTIHVILEGGRLGDRPIGSYQSSKSSGDSIVQTSSSSRNDKRDATEFGLIEINGERIELSRKFELYDGDYSTTKTIIQTEEKAKQIAEDLTTKQFIVSDVSKKEMKRMPLPPYTTSTLQQDAARRLGFPGKKTMSIAQKLYEEGFITYHRTDSTTMSGSFQAAILEYVKKTFGEKYARQRFYKTKQKLAQEAHEAIRQTKVGVSTPVVNQELGATFGKLYDLIWKRAVASQMSDAITESTTVLVIAIRREQEKQSQADGIAASSPEANPRDGKSEYLLKANGAVLLFDGFLKVNPQALNDNRLPEFVANEKLKLEKAQEEFHETTAPPRYNDASLIKTLEEKGIGRPSTYATIISTIQDRQYIDREEGRFVPTSVGIAVSDFLVSNFSEIDDIPFTAQMEDELDAIASQGKDWVPMIRSFYEPLSKKIQQTEQVARVQIEVEKTDEICEKCQAPLVIRVGRFGKFLSCSRFPDCDFKKPYLNKTQFNCPKCTDGNIIIRKTKKGRKFYGCSNYPSCNFAAWNLSEIRGKKSK